MSNRELPMMPWYPDQFRSSTATFCWQERALYRSLLDAQWSAGTLPNNEKLLARAARMDVRIFRKFWPLVSTKFPDIGDGKLQNFRLEQHRLAAIARRDALSEAGRRGVQARLAPGSKPPLSRVKARLNTLSLSPSLEEEEHPQPPQGGRLGLTANGGRKPRETRNSSLVAWREAPHPIDTVAKTASLPAEQRLTWAYVRERFSADPATIQAITELGNGDFDHGCRLIAGRDRFTTGDLESRFREAYESASGAA